MTTQSALLASRSKPRSMTRVMTASTPVMRPPASAYIEYFFTATLTSNIR